MSIVKTLRRDFNRSLESIKLMAIEETFDIYFSRFFGYYFAILSKGLGLNPNQVSVMSLITGLVAGVLFYFQQDFFVIIWACFFVTLSGVLDSADGQLARMTGESSDLGRKIDAIIDTLVFIGCYVGGAMYFLQSNYGWWIILIAASGGYCHSIKSGVYEYYKTEFVYYVKGDLSQRIPFPEELKSAPKPKGIWNKVLYYLELDYVKKQTQFHSRARKKRQLMENYAFGERSHLFRSLYTETNESFMTWWALICGTNTHRTALMVLSLCGRMDIYFIFSIVTFLPLFLLTRKQEQLDTLLIDRMNQ